MRFISPKTDFAFKKIFGSESSKPILISFLNSIIYNGANVIQDLTIIDPAQSGQTWSMKDSYLDVKALLEDQSVVIIEMQVLRYPAFDKRILYNTAKAYVNQLQKGMRYGLLNPVIAVTITDFNLFNCSEIINKFQFKEELTNLNYLHQGMRLIFVELPKFKKSLEQLETVTDKWLYFLKEADSLETIPTSLETVREIQQALIIANESNLSTRELDQIEKQRFFLQDQEYILELQQQAVLAQQQLTEEKQQLSRQLEMALQTQQNLILGLLQKKLGELDSSIQTQVLQLSDQKLFQLGETLMDWNTAADLIQWLAVHSD